MDKHLETYSLPKLNHEDIKNLNRPKASKEIEAGVENFPKKKTQG